MVWLLSESKLHKFFLGLANPRKSVFALGKEFYGSPRSTYAALDILQEKGVIEVDSCVNNKKQLLVTFTEKGRKAIQHINELIMLGL